MKGKILTGFGAGLADRHIGKRLNSASNPGLAGLDQAWKFGSCFPEASIIHQ